MAVEGLPVRVEQQLAGVATQPGSGIPGPVHPEPVALARGDGRKVGVPDEDVDFFEVDPGLGAVAVDQAQFHPVGDLGEQREIVPAPS